MNRTSSVVASLTARELERFTLARPRSAELSAAARGVMPSGVPMSWMSLLYEHPPIWVRGGKGSHFEDVDDLEVLNDLVHELTG
jgi:Glutamate-1-semialdehyde aminotransferase